MRRTCNGFRALLTRLETAGEKVRNNPIPSLRNRVFLGARSPFRKREPSPYPHRSKQDPCFFFAACILYKQKRRAFYYPRKRIGESPVILPSFRFEAAWDSPSHVQFRGCFVSGILVGCTCSQQNEV